MVNKSINFDKTRRNRNWKMPRTVSEIWTLGSYKNPELKVKLRWVGARERKKIAFFVTLILSKRKFFNIYVLSQCIVYWISFQSIYSFTYQKTLLHTLSKAFSVSLNPSFLKETLELRQTQIQLSKTQIYFQLFGFLCK